VKIEKERISMTDFLELAKNRYSLRKFSPTPVEAEKMAKILEAGRIAPTAHNNQPQRIKVITDAADLAKVDECTRCRYGAPAVLLVCYDKNTVWVRPFDSENSGDVDASIVTDHMMLEAEELGLHSCWVMYFDPAKTIEAFALPEHIVPVAFLPIGYAAEDGGPSPRHAERLALDDIMI
jgi:nitroreductase